MDPTRLLPNTQFPVWNGGLQRPLGERRGGGDVSNTHENSGGVAVFSGTWGGDRCDDRRLVQGRFVGDRRSKVKDIQRPVLKERYKAIRCYYKVLVLLQS